MVMRMDALKLPNPAEELRALIKSWADADDEFRLAELEAGNATFRRDQCKDKSEWLEWDARRDKLIDAQRVAMDKYNAAYKTLRKVAGCKVEE